jgi:hypothetical protein
MTRLWSTERRATAERAVDLHTKLRSFLIVEFGQEGPAEIAGALMYELASLAAAISTTEDDAERLLTSWRDQAARQIECFGVGRPHP